MYGSYGLAFFSLLAVAVSSALPAALPKIHQLQARANATGENIQTFKGDLPNPFNWFPPPPVYYDASLDDGNGGSQPFGANLRYGTQRFNTAQSALQASCNEEQQNCNDASNDGSSGVSGKQCSEQQRKCQQVAGEIAKKYDEMQRAKQQAVQKAKQNKQNNQRDLEEEEEEE